MTNEELVTRIKAGVDVADNMLALWEQNKRFIYSIANRYKGLAEMDDLEQEGYLALYDAIDGYNQALGVPFANYAAMWIKQKMQRYIQNNGTVRIPVHESEKLREYKKLVNAYRIHLGRKPTRHEISTQMSISYKMVMDLEKAAQMAKLRSLDSLLTMDDDSTTVGDMVADDVDIEADVLDNVQREQLKAVLWPLVDALPDQQGYVLRQRFQENRTLKKTGESIGVTPERIRTIEANALRSLRRSRNVRRLKAFLDETIFSMGTNGNSVARFNTTWTSSTERAAMMIYEEIQRVK